MKKLSAILLISLFAFSQYARQLSYLECKLFNTFKPDKSKCDCEKIAGLEKKDNYQSPVSNGHTHIHLDEFFSSAREINIDPFVNSLEANPVLLHDKECKGIYSRPWQPPNT